NNLWVLARHVMRFRGVDLDIVEDRCVVRVGLTAVADLGREVGLPRTDAYGEQFGTAPVEHLLARARFAVEEQGRQVVTIENAVGGQCHAGEGTCRRKEIKRAPELGGDARFDRARPPCDAWLTHAALVRAALPVP